MQKYRKEEWIFLNCNSPADLAAEYIEEKGVRLSEYDRCRNGHMLVSDFFVDGNDVDFITVIDSMEDAVGIGLYYGSGGYDDYLLVVVNECSVSLRIPNGVPLGDTFRYEGAKRYYETAQAKGKALLPLKLRFRKKDNLIRIWFEEKEVLSCFLPTSLYEAKYAAGVSRVMVKSENTDKKAGAAAVFSGFHVEGRLEGSLCRGSCIWGGEGAEASEVSLHLPAFRNQWTVTDKNGNFSFEGLPYGKYKCVAGNEKNGFSIFELVHDKAEHRYAIPENTAAKRECEAQGALASDAEKISLNGIWNFDWDKEEMGEEEAWFRPGNHTFSRRIEVPFSWQSLQAFGEGFLADAYHLHQNCTWVTNSDEMGHTVWYQREISIAEDRNMNLVLAAVAGFGKIWLNEKLIGATEDFYNPVSIPLGTLRKGHDYCFTIKVTYPFNNKDCCSGKQGFWFTDAPGIWQNVWLEERRPAAIDDIQINYILDATKKTAEISGNILFEQEEENNPCYPDYAEVRMNNQIIRAFLKESTDGGFYADFSFYMENVRLWDTEDPYLYPLEAAVYKDGREIGKSSRKVGLRTVETDGRRILLNKKPLYIRGVLDQGYNPWGIYTYPFIYGERAGSMEYDIRRAKEFGYNLIRMHIKDNEPEWYSLCDELGMLVWDEHPSNFYGTWDNGLWRQRYHLQLTKMIKKHNYHPAVIIFSVFNESWGITGGHEMSPWEETEAQRWQKESAGFYKERNNQVLVIDNSGYAKTGETQILDYHMYPDSYSEAKDFFHRMIKQNYAGSCFNCYNEKNKELMNISRIREILQKNCSMNLLVLDYKGSEEQKEQPVIISEFVHTNQIDQLVRILPGVSGYIRMNLSSQENEDTSPLTNIRTKRDFGYIHEDFSAADYSIVNGRNLIMADYPPLTRKAAGENIEIPIFLSLWEDRLDKRELLLRVLWKGIDKSGREGILIHEYTKLISVCCYEAVCVDRISFQVPEEMNALYMFYSVYDEKELICDNSLQIEIAYKEKKDYLYLTCKAAHPTEWDTDSYYGFYEIEDRQIFWMNGEGFVHYRLPVAKCEKEAMIFQIEVSSCECISGTRLSDELKYPGKLMFIIGDERTEQDIPDAPSDRKGLFSNSAAMIDGEFQYKCSGAWGYGYRVTIPVSENEIMRAADRGYLEIKIECDEAGMIVYGHRMGRYGTDPMLVCERSVSV